MGNVDSKFDKNQRTDADRNMRARLCRAGAADTSQSERTVVR
jgi:hypothetical protein